MDRRLLLGLGVRHRCGAFDCWPPINLARQSPDSPSQQTRRRFSLPMNRRVGQRCPSAPSLPLQSPRRTFATKLSSLLPLPFIMGEGLLLARFKGSMREIFRENLSPRERAGLRGNRQLVFSPPPASGSWSRCVRHTRRSQARAGSPQPTRGAVRTPRCNCLTGSCVSL